MQHREGVVPALRRLGAAPSPSQLPLFLVTGGTCALAECVGGGWRALRQAEQMAAGARRLHAG